MLDQPISALRQRMIDDMTARRFNERAKRGYLRRVRNFAAFLGRPPDTATCEDLRRFQLHLAKRRIGAPTINLAVAALRFFFKATLERPDLARHLTTVQEPRKAPVVLSQEEAARLRRFLLHIPPSGFHRIRRYGLFAGAVRPHNIERARQLLAAPQAASERSRVEADGDADRASPARRRPCCGGRMIVIETFDGVRPARSPSLSPIRIDAS
jgi:hypothetical protein